MILGVRFFDWLAKVTRVRSSGADCHGTATHRENEKHVFCHGTVSQFELLRAGSYLTRDADQAARYAKSQQEATGGWPRVIGALVHLRNPAVRDQIDPAGLQRAEVERLEAQGHDGMANPSMTEVVIFRPEQVHVLFVIELGPPDDARPSPLRS